MEHTGFIGALNLLPPHLREVAARLKTPECVEEIRLRVGFPPSVLTADGEINLGGGVITTRELDAVVEIATGASLHSARESLRSGYINAPGGYRLGLCGTAVVADGEVAGFRALSSIALRIPREVGGIGAAVVSACGGKLFSTLIISPPGMGKTTLLRDLVKIASDGSRKYGLPPARVAVADERGELAAVNNGQAGFYVGRYTDVLSGCPKAQAVMLLLRVMNPEIIALDEVTAPEDIKAIERAANCGVRIFATVRAASAQELRQKPLFERLLETRVFETLVTIRRVYGLRKYDVSVIGNA